MDEKERKKARFCIVELRRIIQVLANDEIIDEVVKSNLLNNLEEVETVLC